MEALLQAVSGALLLSGKLFLIIVPLVIIFEVLRYLAVFRRIGDALDPVMHGIGLSRHAAVPLFTGVFLGIAYGAGIIIKAARQHHLGRREMFLIGLFLATCHAVVEDTLIFVVIGGSGWLMLGLRLLLAFGLTALLAKCWQERTAQTKPGE